MDFATLVSDMNLTFVPKMVLEGELFLNEFKNVYSVCNDFNHESFAKKLGLTLYKSEIHETKKYNGVGFVQYRSPEGTPYYKKSSLCVIFENGLPIAISGK